MKEDPHSKKEWGSSFLEKVVYDYFVREVIG